MNLPKLPMELSLRLAQVRRQPARYNALIHRRHIVMGQAALLLASSLTIVCSLQIFVFLPTLAAVPAPETMTTVQTTTTTVKTVTTTTTVEPDGTTVTGAPTNTVKSSTTSVPSNVGSTSSGSYPLRDAPVPPQPQSNLPSPKSLNQLSSQGIMTKSQGHEHGLITRALGGVASDAGHATMALIGATILNQSPDLPPDDASSPEWPFKSPHRKTLYTVNWTDGSTANISRLPDGSLQVLGSGRRFMMQPEGDGSFAMFGDYGSMATLSPRPGGGYTLMKADGTMMQILPRDGGGFVVTGKRGVTATILPGMNGSHHIIGGKDVASGFLQ